jgi:hypothetical protein
MPIEISRKKLLKDEHTINEHIQLLSDYLSDVSTNIIYLYKNNSLSII